MNKNVLNNGLCVTKQKKKDVSRGESMYQILDLSLENLEQTKLHSCVVRGKARFLLIKMRDEDTGLIFVLLTLDFEDF